jgi:hypothetical protein
MNTDERSQLIDALVEGNISEADFVRLEAEMLVDPEVRQEYYERVELDSLIDVEIRDRSISSEASKVVVYPTRQLPLPWIAGIAAAITFAAVAGWFTGQIAPTMVAREKSEPLARGFGVVAEHVDAKWSGDTPSIQRGEILPDGPLSLASGLVQIDLFSGVALIVEGSADFEILSPMEVRIDSGKVRANVPEQARGFRVHTAAGEVVDLGTEFVLEVDPKRTEVHVIDGEIEWHPADAEMLPMQKGEALHIAKSSGEVIPIAHDPHRFPGIEQLEDTLARGRSKRRDAWLAHSAKLANDPRLLLYYPMNQKDGRDHQIADVSLHNITGSIVRADRTNDRWDSPGAALDFTPAGSRVRVDVPGVHRSLTFYCWARIDSLDRWYNSLFLTDGHEINEPHWQILNDGRLFFSVKKHETTAADRKQGKRDKYEFYSPRIWTPAQAGQWFQIATTYDVENRQLAHYINGEFVSREPIEDKWLVETVNIGPASIGNWSDPVYKRDDPSFAVRNLNGAIDEFAIFKTALTEQEIHDLYELGKP